MCGPRLHISPAANMAALEEAVVKHLGRIPSASSTHSSGGPTLVVLCHQYRSSCPESPSDSQNSSSRSATVGISSSMSSGDRSLASFVYRGAPRRTCAVHKPGKAGIGRCHAVPTTTWLHD